MPTSSYPHTPPDDTSVTVDHGKYTFVVNAKRGSISVLKYGAPWASNIVGQAHDPPLVSRPFPPFDAQAALVHEAATPRHERDLTLAEARSLIGCTILIQRGSAQILSTCLVVDDGDGEWPLLQRAEDRRHSYGRSDIGLTVGTLKPHTRSYIVVSKPDTDPA